MNYVKTIFITTILLSCSIKGEEQLVQNTPINESTSIITDMPTIDNIVQETKEVPSDKLTSLELWNNHLKTLPQNWDATNNVPTNDWKIENFRLAQEALAQDAGNAETLQSSFLAAINSQKPTLSTTLIDLVNEFNNLASKQVTVTEPEAEQAEETTTTTTINSTPEPAPSAVTDNNEPVQSSQSDTVSTQSSPSSSQSTATTTTTTTDSTTTPAQETTKDFTQEWNDQLEKIKTEGKSYHDTDELLHKTYDVANQLLSSQQRTEPALQKDFLNALEVRSVKKALFHLNINEAMKFFNQAIGIMVPEENTPNQEYDPEALKMKQEIKELQQQMMQNEAQRNADRKKELLVQAALANNRKREQNSEHSSSQNMQNLEKRYQEKLAEQSSIAQKAQSALAQHIDQLIAAQKAAAEKGLFAKATETLSNLWYGSSSTQTTQLSDQQQDELLNQMTEKYNKADRPLIKTAWIEFQKLLLTAGEQLTNPASMNKGLINKFKKNLRILTVAHNVISINNACDMIKNSLKSSSHINDAYKKELINDIKSFLKKEEFDQMHRQKETAATAEQIAEEQKKRKQERDDMLLKIKQEEDHQQAENRQQKIAAFAYKTEEDNINQLLAQLSNHHNASKQDNDNYILKAIKQSESLLKLADIISSKDKHGVAQELKSKFTVALLEQQKNNANQLNIHQYMDQFNNAINNLVA